MSSAAEPAARAEELRRAFVAACRAELMALKPGNVHVHAAGHDMTVADFLRSAAAAAPFLCRAGAPVGVRIRAAVEASWKAVRCNTNLGIVLLAAPLLAAAERGPGPLRPLLGETLRALTIEDARAAYAAIARANPAGLGRVAAEDVAAEPSVTLLEAMRLAADRDLVARQYAADYAEVFDVGVARLAREAERGRLDEWATTLVFLDFLADFPDSHIARKFGLDVAETVRREAAGVRDALLDSPRDAFAALLAFDGDLKQRGLNPGTSADLTVATLLAFAIERGG
jgi:triphosphoribosyl-dephospho-CoA synthase